jgi:hypothetical protein
VCETRATVPGSSPRSTPESTRSDRYDANQPMALPLRRLRLAGIGLLLVGLLVAGGGVYLDASAPPCEDPVRPPDGGPPVAGGCGEPGLRWLFGGVAVAAVGVVTEGGSHVLLWRRRRT